MELVRLGADLIAGWCAWSLGHNLGHRWWHDEMEDGKSSFYAHGEREHHRIYDRAGERQYQTAEDPKELFISFPLLIVGIAASVFVALYGWLSGWSHALPFACTFYASMILDHQLHIQFHKETRLPGALASFRQMHLAHHATHNKNYFFVTGLVWDVMFRSALTGSNASAAADGGADRDAKLMRLAPRTAALDAKRAPITRKAS
jgi:hypothetical protein